MRRRELNELEFVIGFFEHYDDKVPHPHSPHRLHCCFMFWAIATVAAVLFLR